MKNHSQAYVPSILITEDDVILSEIFAYAFQLSGFKVMTCRDGIEAKEILIAQQPEAILLDLHLPKLSGEDLFTFIQNDYSFPDIITILATGDSRRASFLQNRVDYSLLKPVSFSQIKQIAARIHREIQLKAENAKNKPPTIIPNSDTGPISPLPSSS